jgi:hypothetical protein
MDPPTEPGEQFHLSVHLETKALRSNFPMKKPIPQIVHLFRGFAQR